MGRRIQDLNWALNEYSAEQPWLGLIALFKILGSRTSTTLWGSLNSVAGAHLLFLLALYSQFLLPTQPLSLPVFVRQGEASASLEQGNDIIKMVLDMKSKIQNPILPSPAIRPQLPLSHFPHSLHVLWAQAGCIRSHFSHSPWLYCPPALFTLSPLPRRLFFPIWRSHMLSSLIDSLGRDTPSSEITWSLFHSVFYITFSHSSYMLAVNSLYRET